MRTRLTVLFVGLAAPIVGADGVIERPDPPVPLPTVQSYEPLYFLLGGTPTSAKFQISARVRLFNPGILRPDHGMSAQGMYFAYSQTSFWDLESESRPFYESTYRPELFWLEDGLKPDWLPLDADLQWQAGVRHESNGQPDPDSRSVNRLYLTPTLTMLYPHRRFISLRPSAWIYFGDLSDNPDIAEYRGYFDVEAKIGKYDGLQAAIFTRIGSQFDRGYIRADVSHPLSRFGPHYFTAFLHIQGEVGYSDSLQAYRTREARALIGLSFVR